MIGPKMYNSNGSDVDDPYGSTKLHKDMTDALNLMVWAAEFPDGKPGYALWHLFPPEVTAIIQQFLYVDEGFPESGDLINGQCVYLNKGLLECLHQKRGVRPHVVYQYPGQAVFIPVGWAHQVYFFPCVKYFTHGHCSQVGNKSDAIKIACDFISLQNLVEMSCVSSELREHRLTSQWGKDILALYDTLYHAYRSFPTVLETISRQQHVLHTSNDQDPCEISPEVSTMAVDLHPPGASAMEVDNPPSTSREVSAMGINNSPLPHTSHTPPGRLQKLQLRHLNQKQKRMDAILEERAANPGKEFICPLCPGDSYFNRGGLLCHMCIPFVLLI